MLCVPAVLQHTLHAQIADLLRNFKHDERLNTARNSWSTRLSDPESWENLAPEATPPTVAVGKTLRRTSSKSNYNTVSRLAQIKCFFVGEPTLHPVGKST